jgi:D-aminoacyl-tRNA deacylase
MRALIQRVSRASVTIGSETIAAIGKGLAVLLGAASGDSEKDVKFLAEKTANLRIFEDDGGKMNLSTLEIKGEILVVSQFTLIADTVKGRRPSFMDAAPPDVAEPLIEQYIAELRSTGLRVSSGRFRAYMSVEIINDGPVTIILDSAEKFKANKKVEIN